MSQLPQFKSLIISKLRIQTQVIARYGYMDQVDHSQRFLGQLIATIEFKLKNSAGKQPAVGPRRKRPSMARLSASFEGANSNSNSNLPGSLSDSNGARRVSADIHVRAGSGASDGSQAATNGDSNGAHVIRMPPGPSGEGAEGEDGADGGAQRHDFRRRPTQVGGGQSSRCLKQLTLPALRCRVATFLVLLFLFILHSVWRQDGIYSKCHLSQNRSPPVANELILVVWKLKPGG